MFKLKANHIPWIFLCGLSLAGVMLAWLATSKYGAGVAGDSIHYLSVASNLLKGLGFVDIAEAPLIFFPPLFPLLIAGLAWLFRADVFVVGWGINLLLWGVNIFLSGFFLKKVFRSRPVYFYLGTLIVFFSTSALAMHTSILTDPLFLTLTLLFFLAGESYIQKEGWQPWLAMLLIAILAPLLRYSGFAQVVAGGLIILYAHGRNFLKSIPLAGIFGGITLLPVALWIYLHNYLPHGTWWGTNNSYGADVPVNFLQSLLKMTYWFIPYRPITASGLVEPVVLLALALMILLLINGRADWQNWVREMLRPLLVSMLVLTVVYYSSTILNLQTADHKSLFSDRYFVILLVPVLVLIFTSFDHLVLPHIRLPRKTLKVGLLIMFGLWLVYPGYKDYKLLRECRAGGECGYNLYNTRAYHESELLARVKALLQAEPGARLYSNIPPAVWLYTRHTVLFPPAYDIPRTKDMIKTSFAGWPHDKPGYYIWFEPDPFELFMSLNDLSLVADMQPVEKSSDGMIVRVQTRPGN
ncbi:MAG TPA: hypothetical protein VGK00_17385 [Anaerolineales bacterium]|jgi:hypothetical protein